MERAEFVHVFVQNEDGLFLQHRDNIPSIYDPDKLSAFGGHVDSEDPTFRQAAVRELREETGLTLPPYILSLRGITRRRQHDLYGDIVRKIVYGFSVNIPNLQKLECHEGQGAFFVPFGYDLSKLGLDISDLSLAELKRYYAHQFQFIED